MDWLLIIVGVCLVVGYTGFEVWRCEWEWRSDDRGEV